MACPVARFPRRADTAELQGPNNETSTALRLGGLLHFLAFVIGRFFPPANLINRVSFRAAGVVVLPSAQPARVRRRERTRAPLVVPARIPGLVWRAVCRAHSRCAATGRESRRPSPAQKTIRRPGAGLGESRKPSRRKIRTRAGGPASAESWRGPGSCKRGTKRTPRWASA